MLNCKQIISQSSGNELVPHFPKKFKLSLSAGKTMPIALWDSCGIILAHFMPKGQTVPARYYSEVILKNTQRKNENVVSQASPEKNPSFA